MANTINLGLDTVSTIKIGADNVDAVYVGDVLVYSGGTPPTPPTVLPKYFKHTTLLSGDTIPQGYIAGLGNIADSTFISKNMVLGDYPNGVCCEITTSSYFQGDIVRDSTNTPTRAPQVDVYYNYKNSGGTLCEGIDVTGVMSSNNWMPFSRKGCSGNIVSMYYEDGTHINNFGYANYLCEIHPIDSANTKYNMFTYDDAINNSEKCYGIKIDLEETYEDGYYFTVEGIDCYSENNEIIHVERFYYITYYDGQWGVFSGTSPDDFIEYIDDTTGVFNFSGDLGKFGGRIAEASEELLESGLYLLQDTPTPQTLQWVEFNSGDVIPSDLNIYGIKGVASDISYGLPLMKPFQFTPSRSNVEVSIWSGTGDGSYICYSDVVGQNDNVEYILSDVGCNEFVNFAQSQTLTETMQFLIYQ